MPGSSQMCDYSYQIGTTVTLEATASPDSVFLGWGPGPCTGTQPTCVVTVNEAAAPNQAPSVSAGQDQTITLPWGDVVYSKARSRSGSTSQP